MSCFADTPDRMTGSKKFLSSSVPRTNLPGSGNDDRRSIIKAENRLDVPLVKCSVEKFKLRAQGCQGSSSHAEDQFRVAGRRCEPKSTKMNTYAKRTG
jgi:hypothetical protein